MTFGPVGAAVRRKQDGPSSPRGLGLCRAALHPGTVQLLLQDPLFSGRETRVPYHVLPVVSCGAGVLINNRISKTTLFLFTRSARQFEP